MSFCFIIITAIDSVRLTRPIFGVRKTSSIKNLLNAERCVLERTIIL